MKREREQEGGERKRERENRKYENGKRKRQRKQGNRVRAAHRLLIKCGDKENNEVGG